MAMRRFLSAADRGWLFAQFNGRCAGCNAALDHGWEADHIVPYCQTKRTVKEEMQPLCKPCHRKKTKEENTLSQLKKFRKHQRELNDWFRDNVVDGKLMTDTVTLDVTPAGGKSTLPSIMARHLISQDIIDLVVWVTPRQNLSKQAAEDFFVERGEWFSEVRGERFYNPYHGRRRKNTVPLLSEKEIYQENVRCYTTTYNSILSAFTEQKKGLHDYMFSKYRCALVLDECHHLADTGDQPFTEAIKPLREAAVITMVMTGTADRQDRKQIYGLKYDKDASSQLYKPNCDIKYSRSDAVGEGAKLPITFHVVDGIWNFEEEENCTDFEAEKSSVTGEVVLSTADDAQRKHVFKHGMNTDSEWVAKTIDDACKDFIESRQLTAYPHAQMIVVLTLQSDSDYWARHIRREHGLKVALAVSNNDEAAVEIDAFRKGAYDVLVTVGMAYEGLDAPAVTHMAVLRNIRSEPFLEQCFDRATRIDRNSTVKSHAQCAHIFVPSDEKLQGVIRSLKEAQAVGVAELQRRVKAQEVKDFNGELADDEPRLVATSQLVLKLIEADSAGEEVTREMIDEAKAAMTANTSIDQLLAINKLDREFRKKERNQRKIDKGTYNPDDDGKEPRIEPNITVSSRQTDTRLCTLDTPIFSEQQIEQLELVIEEYPMLKWAPADRVLKDIADGRLNF